MSSNAGGHSLRWAQQLAGLAWPDLISALGWNEGYSAAELLCGDARAQASRRPARLQRFDVVRRAALAFSLSPQYDGGRGVRQAGH